MPVSYHHNRTARLNAKKTKPELKRYKIIDPTHKPDLRNELGGGKVQRHGNDQFVHLTDRQAKFYIDQGSIELAGTPMR